MIYSNLIIHQKIWKQLETMVENKKLPPCLIFHGPKGTGKEAHAIELAYLLNQNEQDDEKTKKFQHPNINLTIPFPREKNISKKSDAIGALSEKSLELLINMKQEKMHSPYKRIFFEKASSILINSIRDIKKNTRFTLLGRNDYTIYLIFEAEKLCAPKREAGNALLKILEEPPQNTLFILVTDSKEKILDTILSRSCDFYFPKLSKSLIENYLKNQNYQTDESIPLLYKLCDGNLTDIINIIDLNWDIQKMKKEAITLIDDLIKNKKWHHHYEMLEGLFRTKKEKLKIFIKLIIFILYDLEKIKNKYSDCLILKDIKKVRNLDYFGCIETLENTYQNLYKNLNPAIGLFAMMIEIKQILLTKKEINVVHE